MKTIFTLAVVTAFFCSAAVNAEENTSLQDVIEDEQNVFLPHVGGLFGVIDPSNSQGEASIHFGLDFGFQPVNQFGLGLSVMFYGDREDVSGNYTQTSLVPVLVETSYHFSRYSDLKALSGFHIGTKQGFVFKGEERGNLSGPTSDANTVGFGIGPLIGYDHMISDDFSLGGEINYLFVIDNKNYSAANVSAVLKYWL